MKVSAHGSGLYLRLKRDLCDVFAIKKGDKMRVKLETLIRYSEDASPQQTK